MHDSISFVAVVATADGNIISVAVGATAGGNIIFVALIDTCFPVSIPSDFRDSNIFTIAQVFLSVRLLINYIKSIKSILQ